MLFAMAAPEATRKPIVGRVAGLMSPIVRATMEAMNRFEGPQRE